MRLQPIKFYYQQLEGGTNPLVSLATTERMLQHPSLPDSTRRRLQPCLQAPTLPSTTQPPLL